MKPERSLATVLFTDIVGSTERAAELGDRGWHELLDEFLARVRMEIHRFGGHLVSTAGDGSLATFERPARAVRCAWAIREAVRELGLEIRSGVHSGEIEHHGRDVGGIAVNIGARAASQAGPGEVLVTSTVRELVTGAGFRFEDRGKHRLKGVPGEWQLYGLKSLPAGSALRTRHWIPELKRKHARVIGAVILAMLAVVAAIYVGTQSPGPGASGVEEEASFAPGPGIAVLPFSVHGEELTVLHEGMVDLLSTGLDGAAGLRTISPGTLFARWGEHVSSDQAPSVGTALEVARRTGARYALIGSVVAVGARVRVVADVYDVGTGERLGQGRVEGSQNDVLQLVDRLAVDVLRIILQQGEEELPKINLASLTTKSSEALRAYLEGEVHFRHFDLVAAEQAFKRAVEADSTFPLADYRLADTYLWPAGATGDPTPHLQRAVRLSDRLPAREAVLVRALHAQQLRTLDGVEPLRELVQTHPEDAEAWYLLAETYLHLPAAWATADEIAQLFERAVELDPRNAKYLLHHVQFAWWLEADSVLSRRRVDIYKRAAPRHPLARAGPLALALAFGDSLARSRAMSGLREEDFEVIADVDRLLHHPRYSALPAVLRELKEHANDRQMPWVVPQANRDLFMYYALWHGQLRRALPHIEHLTSTYDPWRGELLYTAKLAGLPISHEQLQAFALIDSTAETWQLYFGGVLAADDGNWPNHSRAIAEFERRKERALTESDSLIAESRENAVQALKAYGLWRRGSPASALPTFSDPRRLDRDQYSRWRLAQVYQELGHLRDAERIYNSFNFLDAMSIEPLAQYQLGEIYEALGEYDKATESYEYFAEHWKNADPELQPMVKKARQAVVRLRGLRRE